MMTNRLKDTLGQIPYTAEIYWTLRRSGKPPVDGFSLEQLHTALPEWISQVQVADQRAGGKKVLIFSMLPYWIEQTSLMGLALVSLGHDVTLAYLPYGHWKKPVALFDARRQNVYMREMLKPLEKFMSLYPVLGAPQIKSLPVELTDQMASAAYRDLQYSLLREDVDPESDLYKLRLDRNSAHARAMLKLLQNQPPDVLIVPNGSMLEFGISYLVAQYLEIPVMTYEFGEQSERMWLAQNEDVMEQDTSKLWQAKKMEPLQEREWDQVKEFFSTRQGGGLWENFSRQWQGTSSQGGEAARVALGLDHRPIVLLPTNVLGDSLTLGRHLISESMTDWLIRTIQYFKAKSGVQLVIRVHPGEQIGWGPSVYDILIENFPELPENIHLLPAGAQINTYDLVNTADVGLVFTTTVGMEMAMIGLPVIVTGETHYRHKGFTLDAESWEDYLQILDQVLDNPKDFKPTREAVETAWTYAYRFFFEYPQPFPWHVQHFWDDVSRWPLERVLSDEGMHQFGDTFRYLIGEPIEW
jgi:hypothetical protein